MIPVAILGFWARWKLRIILGGIGLLAVGLALRYWGNAQYSKGRIEERQDMTVRLQKAANEARDAARAELAGERETLATAQQSLEKARLQFSADQKRLDAQMRTGFASIENSLSERNSRVIQTPADDRSDVVRAFNIQLRAGRSPRAAAQP